MANPKVLAVVSVKKKKKNINQPYITIILCIQGRRVKYKGWGTPKSGQKQGPGDQKFTFIAVLLTNFQKKIRGH